MKSRFAIIGALAAMLLALLYVAPLFASSSWNDTTDSGGNTLGVAVLDPSFGLTTAAYVVRGKYYDALTGGDTGIATETDDLGSVERAGLPPNTVLAPRAVTYNVGHLPDAGIAEVRGQGGVKYTKVGNTVWVAAGGSAPWGDADTVGDTQTQEVEPYSLVYVRVSVDANDDDNRDDISGTVTADVRNVTASGTLNAGHVSPVTETTLGNGDARFFGGVVVEGQGAQQRKKLVLAADSNFYEGYFFVTREEEELPGGHASIVASDGDVIEITYADATRIVKVDAVAPSISGTAPAHETIQTQTSSSFAGTITDAGSGLAPDIGNESGVGAGEGYAPGAGDADEDGVTSTEPRAKALGYSRDILIHVGTEGSANPPDVSSSATSGWSLATTGAGFSFSFPGPALAPNRNSEWSVTAYDRVRNKAQTDADATTPGFQPYVITVDTAVPRMGSAEAGQGYSADKKKTVGNPSSIKVVFTASGSDNPDNLRAGSVDEGDFRIEASATDTTALAIASVLHPNHKVDSAITDSENTQNVVYITLASPLAANAEPKVYLIGTVTDVSGLSAAPAAIVSVNKIAPTLGVTVAGAPGERPVVKGTSTDKAVIRITSDETLKSPPSVYLANYKLNDAGDVVVGATQAVSTVKAVAGATNIWEAEAQRGSLNGLTGVYATGQDNVNPANTGGAAPVMNDEVPDLSQVTLFEFDNSLALADQGDFTLTPSRASNNKTESSSPFVTINFSEEAEYNLRVSTTDEGVDRKSVGQPPVSVEIDSHNAVTLTKLTLTDSAGAVTDLLGTEGAGDGPASFIVQLNDLSLGLYTLRVNGTDAAGNSLSGGDAAYNLEVTARAPFGVKLSPGFNLISVPGDPIDPSLDSVLPSSHPATTVLSYAPNDPNGPWLTATRAAGMDWSDTASNTLSEIKAGHGYWVETNGFVGISTLLTERPAAAVPPTYAVSAGWNLLGITDVALKPAGTKLSVDTYLASTPWSVVYTFDTQANAWTKHSKRSVPLNVTMDTPLGPGVVKVGQGLWAYMTADGALAP